MVKRVISYFGVFFLYALSLLPLAVLYSFATVLYWFLYYIIKYRRDVVKLNLVNSFPEKSADEIKSIEKRYYKYLANLIFEIVKMSTFSKAELQRRFKITNIDLINHHLERGDSVVACSAHYGNWEWGTAAVGLSANAPSYAIYKPLSNKAFDEWFNKLRTRFGTNMVAMRQTFRAISNSRNSVTLFLFGNDQAPPKDESHQWRIFLNQQTSTQLGMEKIALKTNRPIYYFKATVIKKGYYELECVPLCMDPSAFTQQEITALHTELLEAIIREKPEYWLWSHKRWKHQPNS